MVLLTVRMHGRNKRENVIYRAHAHSQSYRDCYVPCAYAHGHNIVPETYLPCARPQSKLTRLLTVRGRKSQLKIINCAYCVICK